VQAASRSARKERGGRREGLGVGESDVWAPRIVVGIKEKYEGRLVREN
jgi:hypothetical protein